MLRHLIDRTHSEETTEADGLIVGFDRVAEAVTLQIQLFDAESTAPLERWRVLCEGVEEFRIFPEQGNLAAFDWTHAAVRQYLDPQAQIFFAGAAQDPVRTAERLRAAHQRIAGDWIPFERYMSRIPTGDLLSQPGGKLFSGPLFMALEFELVLRDLGITTTRLPEEVAERPLADSPLTMLVVGTSYIIAAK